jgi:hypothetical protein
MVPGLTVFAGGSLLNALAREGVKSAALNADLDDQGAVIAELVDMLSLDDGQLSTINGVLANGSHPRPTRSSPTGPGISNDKEHDHG